MGSGEFGAIRWFGRSGEIDSLSALPGVADVRFVDAPLITDHAPGDTTSFYSQVYAAQTAPNQPPIAQSLFLWDLCTRQGIAGLNVIYKIGAPTGAGGEEEGGEPLPVGGPVFRVFGSYGPIPGVPDRWKVLGGYTPGDVPPNEWLPATIPVGQYNDIDVPPVLGECDTTVRAWQDSGVVLNKQWLDLSASGTVFWEKFVGNTSGVSGIDGATTGGYAASGGNSRRYSFTVLFLPDGDTPPPPPCVLDVDPIPGGVSQTAHFDTPGAHRFYSWEQIVALAGHSGRVRLWWIFNDDKYRDNLGKYSVVARPGPLQTFALPRPYRYYLLIVEGQPVDYPEAENSVFASDARLVRPAGGFYTRGDECPYFAPYPVEPQDVVIVGDTGLLSGETADNEGKAWLPYTVAIFREQFYLNRFRIVGESFAGGTEPTVYGKITADIDAALAEFYPDETAGGAGGTTDPLAAFQVARKTLITRLTEPLWYVQNVPAILLALSPAISGAKADALVAAVASLRKVLPQVRLGLLFDANDATTDPAAFGRLQAAFEVAFPFRTAQELQRVAAVFLFRPIVPRPTLSATGTIQGGTPTIRVTAN